MEEPVLRLLVVEDSKHREDTIRSWCCKLGVRKLNCATSAGAALGILSRDSGRIYAGIMLDHDLQQRPHGGIDHEKCGQDVVMAIIKHIDKDVPILVHSMNDAGGAAMVRQLEDAGFAVTRVPWAEMSLGVFEEWLEEVREGVEG